MRVKGKVGEIINNLTVHFFTRSDEEWTDYGDILDFHVSWNDSSHRANKNWKRNMSFKHFSPELSPIMVV